MDELRVIKTAISVSKVFNILSTLATAVALLSTVCVAISFLKKAKA
ncbi:MAG: hypothetical protein IJZ88_03390 [Clostridia bacterium]|nr:hypothetical protein [Clostridia bacterium]